MQTHPRSKLYLALLRRAVVRWHVLAARLHQLRGAVLSRFSVRGRDAPHIPVQASGILLRVTVHEGGHESVGSGV